MKKISFFLKVLLVFAVVYLPSLPVYAQTSRGLTVSPPINNLEMEPGEEKRIQIKFYNNSSESLVGFIKKADFLVLDDQGSPTLFDTTPANNKYTASSWLTLSDEKIAIAGSDSFILTVYIKVPINASGCSHYAAVFFEPANPNIAASDKQKQAETSVAFRLSSLLDISIAGAICKEKAFISKIFAPKFMEYGPIPVELSIANRSDSHITPKIYVAAQNMLKKPVDLKVLPSINVFPDAIRNYKTEIGQKWMFGSYRLLVNGGYGKTGQTLTSYIDVFVFPWKVTLAIILAIIVIVLLGKGLYQGLVKKEATMEAEIRQEKEEIEKLKKQLKSRD